MTCKDCVYEEVCHAKISVGAITENAELCKNFKNKADFVEVVRCKDCKYYSPDKKHGLFHTPCSRIFALCICHEDSFCSYGERKTD